MRRSCSSTRKFVLVQFDKGSERNARLLPSQRAPLDALRLLRAGSKTLRAARPDSSPRKKRLFGMTTKPQLDSGILTIGGGGCCISLDRTLKYPLFFFAGSHQCNFVNWDAVASKCQPSASAAWACRSFMAEATTTNRSLRFIERWSLASTFSTQRMLMDHTRMRSWWAAPSGASAKGLCWLRNLALFAIRRIPTFGE